MIKILAIIPVLNRYPKETIKSLLNQTIKPSRIIIAAGSSSVCQECKIHGIDCIYVKPNFYEHVGIRMTKAMNIALQSVNINNYDYILKLDDDVILPPKFIEMCIKENADCVGGSGCAQLFKVSTFIKLFNGRFPEVVSEDTYREFAILATGRKLVKWPIEPIYFIKKKHSWRYYYEIGYNRYKLGYDFIHILFHLRHGINYVFYLIGYISALIHREKKYSFANNIFWTKIKEIPKQLKEFLTNPLKFF
ncbi:MAG: glycosyltransferase family 2 protein [Candidatus Methanomethylicia archaeon]|nr:glycosyltransferase family 2 protein [Candidatus Methanomethylicia archaeon]